MAKATIIGYYIQQMREEVGLDFNQKGRERDGERRKRTPSFYAL